MEFPKSLEPDEEQKLFEALSMEKSDYDILQFIRGLVKYIVIQEGYNGEETKKPEVDLPGTEVS